MFIASSADLPFAASGPVSAMPNPMRIGLPDCAEAGACAPRNAAMASAAAARHANARPFKLPSIVFLPCDDVFRQFMPEGRPAAKGIACGLFPGAVPDRDLKAAGLGFDVAPQPLGHRTVRMIAAPRGHDLGLT